jgi:hypothetical protein
MGPPELSSCLVTTDYADRLVAAQKYRGAEKSLARPGNKQATATEDFDFNVSYL